MPIQSLQLCPTFCNPMGCSPPGSSVHGIFSARILDSLPLSNAGDTRDAGWISGLGGSPLEEEMATHSTILARKIPWTVVQRVTESAMTEWLSTHKIRETWAHIKSVGSLDWEGPLQKGMAMHSNRIAWGISWTEEPGRLQSMGSHDWAIVTFT